MSTEFDAAWKAVDESLLGMADKVNSGGVPQSTTEACIVAAAIFSSARLVALAIRDSKPHSGD